MYRPKSERAIKYRAKRIFESIVGDKSGIRKRKSGNPLGNCDPEPDRTLNYHFETQETVAVSPPWSTESFSGRATQQSELPVVAGSDEVSANDILNKDEVLMNTWRGIFATGSVRRRTANDLLRSLQIYGCSVPGTLEGLMGRSELEHTITEMEKGYYLHIGMQPHIERILKKDNANLTQRRWIRIDINTDGVSIFKSSKTVIWPILGSLVDFDDTPFLIGCYLDMKRKEKYVTTESPGTTSESGSSQILAESSGESSNEFERPVPSPLTPLDSHHSRLSSTNVMDPGPSKASTSSTAHPKARNIRSNPTPADTDQGAKDKSEDPMIFTPAERKLLKCQAEILVRVTEIQKAVQSIEEKQTRRDEPLTSCFKIKTAEALRLFEEKLEKDEFPYTQVFREYRPDVSNPAHSGLGKILSDDLMETLNLKGVKGRKAFKDTPLYNVLWVAWGPLGGQFFTDKKEFDASVMMQIKASRNRQYVKKCRAKANVEKSRN